MANTIQATEDMVGKYLNEYLYTDVNPIGKIVGIKSKTVVLVKRVIATRDESVKLEFHVGGFSAHCSNQHAQKWHFTETDEVIPIRISKGYLRRNRIDDKPRCFYDYNF